MRTGNDQGRAAWRGIGRRATRCGQWGSVAALIGLAVAAPVALRAALGGGDRLIVVQPGYPGSTDEAREFIGRFVHAIRAGGGPDLTAGEYHNEEKAALEAIRRDHPTVGIVSLGFYLEHREDLALHAVLWSQPDEPFHIVVRKGTLKRPEDLRGKSVTGTPLVEPHFVARILFAPKVEKDRRVPGPAEWKVEPARYFSAALRDVRKGREDAALLSDREYRGMKRLPSADDLELLHTTAAFPVAVVVTIGKEPVASRCAALVHALTGLGGSEAGRELLATMGIERFARVDADRLRRIEDLYGEDGP